ncbi:MAG: T9SS type A sorting domain-containing protein [Bacteroidia bacterium]|nr:T9SS type A sorting domain-containing protein [Bacteroidia bacterium]
MKKTTLVFLFSLVALGAFASGLLRFQARYIKQLRQIPINRCGVTEYENMLNIQNPQRAAERAAYDQMIANKAAAYSSNPSVQGGTITIPVVVHIVWNTAGQNITDNQVLSQIQVLNEDYSRTNADASNTPSYFQGVAANTDIQFCLAQTDPNGNPTTGIERRQISSNVVFNMNNNVKNYNTDGLNAWDVTRYFNIWVCNLTPGLLGYAEFPTSSPSNTFGVVIGFPYFGSNFTSYGSGYSLSSAYNRGRTTTHEIGHCFNLIHIWGDDGSGCNGTDQCNDTPNQADEHYGCPSTIQISCSNSPNGDMYQNYMDYTDDACMNMFTLNQKSRMLSVLNSSPYNALQSSSACNNAAGNDAGISAVLNPNGTACSTTFNPVVTIKNFGTNPLTSATINYRIDAGPIQVYNWTGNLATNATQNVTLNSMTSATGTHTFSAYTLNPNGGTDANAGNDQAQSTYTVSSGSVALPYSEGFESTTFPSNGITINNPDNAVTWSRTTTAASTGTASAFMDNFDYNANGQVDEMVLPALNLNSATNPVITFQLAYKLFTDPNTSPNYSDTLKVLISTDCGVTWTTLFSKSGAALTTTTPNYGSGEFTPGSNDWRWEIIPLNQFQFSGGAIIKFRHTTDFENNLYIDDINIHEATDVEENTSLFDVDVYPNPASDNVNINVQVEKQHDLTIRLINPLGQIVSEEIFRNSSGGTFMLDVADEAPGVYFAEIIAGNRRVMRKIMIQH